MLKKIKSTSGFSLTEVMIGIMILTVAIVSASNLLVSLVKTNRLNVQTLQAYYLAQEGIEAVRNIRDTNWLHNMDFNGVKGEEECGQLFGCLEVGNYYSVSLAATGWSGSELREVESQSDLRAMVPWNFEDGTKNDNFNQIYAIAKNNDGFYTSTLEDAQYYRHIEILDACENDEALKESFATNPDKCKDFVLVRSVVNWMDGSRERDVTLDAVLSNWKGGAL